MSRFHLTRPGLSHTAQECWKYWKNKQTYDVIVIDNPPVGIVTDGIRVIKLADYPVYVFRRISQKEFRAKR
ncbi:MAG: hypothetical protein R2850_08475 [Bacteroidia bacterium]